MSGKGVELTYIMVRGFSELNIIDIGTFELDQE